MCRLPNVKEMLIDFGAFFDEIVTTRAQRQWASPHQFESSTSQRVFPSPEQCIIMKQQKDMFIYLFTCLEDRFSPAQNYWSWTKKNLWDTSSLQRIIEIIRDHAEEPLPLKACLLADLRKTHSILFPGKIFKCK